MKKPAEKQLALLTDYKATFGSAAGQRVLWDLMKTNFMVSSTMAAGASSHELSFREGSRNAVLRILKILKTTPDQLQSMIDQGEEDDARY
jgi:hypothetical protein